MVKDQATMKYGKGFLLLLGVLCGWWCAAAHAQVYSLNAAAVLSISLQANQPELVAVQLIPVGASGNVFTVTQVFGTNTVVSGTQVRLYNAASDSYYAETYSSGSWTPGTGTVQRGQSLWVRSPSNALLKMVGYVPGTAEATTTVQVVSGMQLLACPYPVAGSFTNASMGQGVAGDIILPVGGDGSISGNADPVAFYSGVGWHPSDGRFDVAAGWWYKSYSNRTWTVTKPYAYP